MKLGCTLMATKDMAAAKKFYTGLMELPITGDLGSNVAFGDRLALQEMDMWVDFVGVTAEDVNFGGRQFELVFEIQEFDAFVQRLKADWPDVKLIHDVRTFPWGQRVIRFEDPDGHAIEVGEEMPMVALRLLREGKSLEQVAAITMFPPEVVKEIAAGLDKE